MLMILACLSMLIDHVGGYLLGNQEIFRMIGRLAMPMYAYLIVAGVKHTSDSKKYLKRLFINALAAQLPYIIMTESYELDICFVWLISAMLLMAYENKALNLFCKSIISILLVGVTFIIPMDYGVYAIVWILVFYFRDKFNDKVKHLGNIIVFIGPFIAYCVWQRPIQFAALCAIPLIFLCSKYDATRLRNKYAKTLYQLFYPLHMTIIDIIKIVNM